MVQKKKREYQNKFKKMESNLKTFNLLLIAIIVLAIFILFLNKQKKEVQNDLLKNTEENILLAKMVVVLVEKNQKLNNQTLWQTVKQKYFPKG